MSKPKFDIGQRVMIRSKVLPQENKNDVMVTGIHWCYVGEIQWRYVGEIHYRNGNVYKVNLTGWYYAIDHDGRQWHERTLRPRPDTGSDFHSLMEELKKEKSVPV